ncbi:FecCD family ABC transporter permease [Amycolatopsis sacchari]|uniref:Iron complex transport system permease protein n=1 Tax=Amycolatopsis sacchari TaxID=115433 RepID=A0A1I3YJB3_9PSEU|nr:iron chelate uptake ABC transporter family permease subunit [Amycolatopsis sacchari]SFK31922.1 iron complex transport system permease protein [Amycolatopsis sacchari]
MSAVLAVRRRLARRTVVMCAGLAVALAAVFVLSLSIGDYPLSPSQVVGALTGNGTVATHYVVVRLRLPRALLAVLVGMAFGLSGAVFQRLLRNSLASPDIIGVTAGSSAVAVMGIVVFGASGFVLSGASLVGGLVTAVLIYVLAWRRGFAGQRLVVVGIGIAAVLASVMSYFLTRADYRLASLALVWLTGSLNGADWWDVRAIAAFLVVLVPLVLVVGRKLPVLQLGDEVATGLGARVERDRLALLAVAVGLAAVATASAGPVTFAAFLSGAIAFQLLRTGRPSLVAAALTGALLLLVADFAAQHLVGGTQLPVGVVTGAVGAPYLLYLLATANRGTRG